DIDFHLASMVDGHGNPILDLSSAIKQPITSSSGAQWYLNIPTVNGIASFVEGSVGPGVLGADIHVRLLLGNANAGFHLATELDTKTDKNGYARFTVSAGTHPEDVCLAVTVKSNPVNPWFTPVSSSHSTFFYPGRTSPDNAQGRVPYTLRLNLAQLDLRSLFADRIASRFKRANSVRSAGILVRPRRVARSS